MMMKDLEEQIMASVLGEMTPADEARLQTFLKNHPEAHQEWAELKSMAGLLRTDPEVEPDVDFTERLMARIAGLHPFKQPGAEIKGRRPLDRAARFLTWVSNWRECFYVFFLVGFFFLTMGLGLLWGYHRLVSAAALRGWMVYQPQVNICFGLWLLVLSLMMRLGSDEMLRVVQTGTILFMSLAMVNGLALLILNGFPLSAAGGVAYTLGGLILGIYLSSVLAGLKKRLAEA